MMSRIITLMFYQTALFLIFKYWFESSMVIEDGFIYFYDCDGISPSKLSDKYCWFKARKVKYHIIPD